MLHYSTHQLLSHHDVITCKKNVNPYFNAEPKLVVTNSSLVWEFSLSFCSIQATEKFLRETKGFLELKKDKRKIWIA